MKKPHIQWPEQWLRRKRIPSIGFSYSGKDFIISMSLYTLSVVLCLILRGASQDGDTGYVYMIFLLDVFLTALLTEGFFFSLIISIFAVLSVDYIFTPPYWNVIFTLSGPWNKSVTKKADSFAVCFLNLFVGGAALFVLGTALGGRLGSVTPLGILVLLYLAFICGAGYLLWALLMKNNPVSRIAIFGFVNPVVNVLLSAVLNGEPLFRWQYLAALVFVCVGIWLVNKAPAKKEEQ